MMIAGTIANLPPTIKMTVMNNNKKGTYELFKYSDKCNFRYTFSKDRKTVGLLYINYKTKKIFNFIIEPIINKKVKKLGEDYVN